MTTFAPVVDIAVVRLLLAIAAQKEWLVHQIGYSNAFLQGNIDRPVYMATPEMLDGDHNGKVCLHRKSLYGLREAPRIWYDRLSKELLDVGLTSLPSAPFVFAVKVTLCYAILMTFW